jgi:hypothetical protein
MGKHSHFVHPGNPGPTAPPPAGSKITLAPHKLSEEHAKQIEERFAKESAETKTAAAATAKSKGKPKSAPDDDTGA